jgi:hypothetical protein
MAQPLYPKIGEWNHLEASIGARGMGKSTHQCYRAMQLASQANGAYVIGHSFGARLPTHLPDELGGHELPITYHTTTKKLEKGLRDHPERWHILAPPMAGDGHKVDPDAPPETADTLLQFAMRLSLEVRKRAWKAAHPWGWWKANVNYTDVRAPPIIIIIDEGIAIDAASTTRKEQNKWFLQFIYSIRHLHIGMLYAIQNSNARSWQILEQSSAIHVFRIVHQWALNAFRAAGATDDEIQRIQRLPKYQHITLEALDIKELEKSSGKRVPGADEQE